MGALNRVLAAFLAPELAAAWEGEVRHSAGDPERLAVLLGYRLETPLAEEPARLLV